MKLNVKWNQIQTDFKIESRIFGKLSSINYMFWCIVHLLQNGKTFWPIYSSNECMHMKFDKIPCKNMLADFVSTLETIECQLLIYIYTI